MIGTPTAMSATPIGAVTIQTNGSAAPEPPGQWHLRLSRHTDPGELAPSVARIDQHLTDLNAYYNDASLAVWQPFGVSGAAWEAFGHLWCGDSYTLDELYASILVSGISILPGEKSVFRIISAMPRRDSRPVLLIVLR